ncbi:MAG: POTRA domain-containing protein [Lentimicrobium sp.]
MALPKKLFLFFLFLYLFPLLLAAQAPSEIVVGEIMIVGNKVTREEIVLRELEFETGDTIVEDGMGELVKQSVKNLLNLPLFHFVTIDTRLTDNTGTLNFTIYLTERWYTWIWPVFEISDRNFNTWLKTGDLTRISYGMFLQRENFRGRLEKLHFKIKLGYQQELMLLYEKPYLNRRKTLGAGLLFSLARQRETGYITAEDKLIFHRADKYLLHSEDIAVFVRWRPDIHFSHTIQLRYNYLQASDTLLKLNHDYIVDGINIQKFTELSYLMKIDFRDQRAYPLNGFYTEVLLAQKGLSNAAELYFTSAKMVFRGYRSLGHRFFLAGSFTGQLNSKTDLPYNLSQALGYRRDYVRGYEYYVIDGCNFWLTKVNLKYALVRPAVIKLKWPSTDRFNTIPYSVYAGTFIDAGKVGSSGEPGSNSLPGTFLKGIGIGLDFVTYYDKVFRAEFSVNGKGETGFFLHFMAAI